MPELWLAGAGFSPFIPSMSEDVQTIKMVSKNRKAFHEYHILDRYEAGLELIGAEVKSIRDGKVSLQEAYAEVRDEEAWIIGMRINPYPLATHFEPDPVRERRLLLHKREIRRLKAQTDEKGLTVVPLAIYFRGKVCKLELGVARGKKLYDKREAIKKRDEDRKIRRIARRDDE
jgi:SsrA-binding protein